MGEIYVEFNTNMKTGFDISLINETIVDIYVVPDKERELSETINYTLLNLTWETQSYKDNLLIFKVDFENPYEVSTGLS